MFKRFLRYLFPVRQTISDLAWQYEQNQKEQLGDNYKPKYVYYREDRNCWVARPIMNNKRFYLGYFKSQLEAAANVRKFLIENNENY